MTPKDMEKWICIKSEEGLEFPSFTEGSVYSQDYHGYYFGLKDDRGELRLKAQDYNESNYHKSPKFRLCTFQDYVYEAEKIF